MIIIGDVTIYVFHESEVFPMLERLLKLPGFIYQINQDYYYLGKWICKACTEVNETDCVMMYEMSRSADDFQETALYFNKLRAYSDFALEIPYNAAAIRKNMSELIDSLSDASRLRLEKQIQHVEEDLPKFC